MLHARLAAFACAFVAALVIGDAQAEPVKIRVDWSTIPGQFAPLIPTVPKYAPNVYRHYGKSYVVEPMQAAGRRCFAHGPGRGPGRYRHDQPAGARPRRRRGQARDAGDRTADFDRGARLSADPFLGARKRGQEGRGPQGQDRRGERPRRQCRLRRAYHHAQIRPRGAKRLSNRGGSVPSHDRGARIRSESMLLLWCRPSTG